MRRLADPRWLVVVAIAAALALVVLLAILRPDPASESSTSATPSMPISTPLPSEASATPGPGTLGDLLTTLTVEPEHRGGYERDLFGDWIDADGDGCKTNHEVLIDEATVAPSETRNCHLSGGAWFSPYDGQAVSNVSLMSVDHVVALAEAWASGAWAWTPERRVAFANDLGDPDTLIAVTASSNSTKSDLDPAEWLPQAESARCRYLVAWIRVKARWSLSIDDAELDALRPLAEACTEPVESVERMP